MAIVQSFEQVLLHTGLRFVKPLGILGYITKSFGISKLIVSFISQVFWDIVTEKLILFGI